MSPRAVLSLALALWGLVALPLWMVQTPSMLDFPVHAARLHVLAQVGADPDLARYYRTAWDVLPNLALDGLGVFPARWLGAETVTRLFTTLCLGLLLTGPAALQRALTGRWSAGPLLLAAPLLYGRPFLWGLINYLFTLGVGLWGVAAWIHLRRRSWSLRVPLFGLLSVALFMGHLAALGVYAVLCGAYELGVLRRTRRSAWAHWALLFGQCLAPAALLLFVSPTSEGAEGVPFVQWGDLAHKARALYSLFNAYSVPLDMGSFAVTGVALAWSLRRGWARPLGPLVWLPAVLGVVFLAAPHIAFSAYAADIRLVLPVALTAAAALEWRAPGRLLPVAALALLLARVAVLSAVWLDNDPLYRDWRAAVDRLPRGVRLSTAAVHAGPWRVFPTPTAHTSCYAIIDRAAFVPTLFAIRNQHPVNFLEPYHAVARDPRGSTVRLFGAQPDWSFVAAHFDYHLAWREDRYAAPAAHHFIPLWSRGALRLYKIPHPPEPR